MHIVYELWTDQGQAITSCSDARIDLDCFVAKASDQLFTNPSKMITRIRAEVIAILLGTIVCLLDASSLRAQSGDEVRRTLVNLRDDQQKHNCGYAIAW